MDFFVVDDEPIILELVKTLLEAGGHQVICRNSGDDALKDIRVCKPDCVLTDIMMPGIDGFELCKKLRDCDDLSGVKIIMMSVKTYEFDRQRARQLGADGYLRKPIDASTFLADVIRIISDRITLEYWGVRGTLPVPGPKSLKYGGNTPCVTLSLPRERLFIFDAGTGIKELSNALLAKSDRPVSACLFLSHPHWDHIQGLPFFAPLYVPGNQFEICGASHSDLSVKQLVSGQMGGVYFPITIQKFGASVVFRDLHEGEFEFDDVHVETMLLSHPGNCLGYRVRCHGKSFCYITDNELFRPDLPQYSASYVSRLTQFIHKTDILIADASYTDEEYDSKIEYGHSCISEVVNLAHRAEVKALHLFHHDPDQTDDDIDRKFESAVLSLDALNSKTRCIAPAERDTFEL